MEGAENTTFIIPVSKDFILYNPLSGISALMNRSGVFEVKKRLEKNEDAPENTSSAFYKLAEELRSTPCNKPIRKTGGLNPDFLGILPTRECNGACNYCDFGAEHISEKSMSYSLAAGAVDWYTQIIEKQKRKVLDIHFFGGEPMMASDVIEVVVHRARLLAAQKDLIPYFEISTNGQYSKEKAKWMGQYMNKVVLSFDGTREIQDKHRPLPGNKSSYDNALNTIHMISDSNADLCIRCCVSQLNVGQMEEITYWLCTNFRLAAINFEILCATGLTKEKGLYPPDPIDFAIHFQRSRELASQYGIEAVYASDIAENPQVSSCPVGKDAAIVSPDGRISNCYLLPERWQSVSLDLDFGILKEEQKADINIMKVDSIRKMVENKPRCNACFCQWSCAGGCHVGNTYPGCSNEYDNFCKQTRLISVFSLLANLDMQEKIDEIINSPESLRFIAHKKSDRLEDFKG